ncbi:MAG: glycosyl transferase [Frankiales bacterium]|jgi:GT2 family glycosyltransferase/glycosyltransferase involved in cell wall biosynthesis|nr:glycosyl transferase [Frankiales bacterium]
MSGPLEPEDDPRVAALVQRLQETEQALRDRTAELAMYQGAATFRFASALGRAVDRALPLGSTRRHLVARGARRALGMDRSQSLRTSAVRVTAGGPAPDSVPTSDRPVVSIVIPVHGRWDLTAACLRSLASTYALTSYEVVVVDDASPDDTRARLADVAGVRVHALDENVGFLRACNAGIAQARGEWVLLLNNDTEVQQGWLDALVRAARSAPDIGVVGARLLNGDGTLQDAGGIVFSDGTPWNYGRRWSPEDPRVLHRREVDYVTGAVLLARRSLLEQLGGFDERFVPAYFEDTDLGFAARAAGFRVLYEPAAVVVHDEGGSHGTDERSGVKAYQEVNRQVFRDKWAAELATQPPYDPARVSTARVHGSPRRLLVVDHGVPMPDRDSGSRRMRELLGLLVEAGWAVTLVPDNGAALEPYTSDLREAGVEVLAGPTAAALDALGEGIEVAVLSRLHVAERWLPLVRRRIPGVRTVFDTVDLHFLRSEREAALTGAGTRGAQKVRERELAVLRQADASLVVSPVERDLLARELPQARVAVVSNVEPPAPQGGGPEGRAGLLFVGSCLHPPNLDGVRWFVESVLPMVVEELPDVVLRLAGSGPPETLQALAGPHVEVLGWVPDLEPVYAAARVSVAPLRYGAGVKGKVGDALRHGLPVAGTSTAVEGMGLLDGEHVLVGDDPRALADAVVRLHRDDALWESLRAAGRERVLDEYSRERAAAALLSVLGDLAPR